ncbi:hypothetical protein TSUD_105400 [Trifolium subterraneum]|uniref:Bulb-type lectin domain-containing protein n=1 Tax=Trifolium subterraneum TaxID=3900 RepID=A0A2Z6LXP6_TRISU|nr:hypothetical protein TSUD_105400 [Trifolium subterraneum]
MQQIYVFDDLTIKSSVVAILLDSGNLVLRNRPDDDAIDPLWQSFDYQTNTFLPGGKIKQAKKTTQPQYLTSWKNNEDPSTGLFSLELDPKGTYSYLIVWNKSEQYWTSGPWNGRSFSLVPEMGSNYNNFVFVLNQNESYFTYSVNDLSILSRNGCSIWNGGLIDVQLLSSDDSSGKILYLKLATSEFRDSSKFSYRARVIIGVVGAA